MPDGQEPMRSDDAVREEALTWLTRLRTTAKHSDHEAFQTWYASDARHADIYDDVLSSWDKMGAAARTPVGEAYSRQASAQRRWLGTTAARLSAACVLLILLLAGLNGFGVFGAVSSDPDRMRSRIGEIRTAMLSDGTRVTLDTGSVISVTFRAGERRVILERGRVRFDVAHDTDRPFIVSAGSGDVIAHGTLFDVDLQGHHLTVSLLRGSVEVKRHADTGSGQMLIPGQMASVEGDGLQHAPVAIHADDSRWPDGMLYFRNAPLSEVITSANSYAVHRIALPDKQTAALRFSGAFRANDTAGLTLLLSETFHLSVSRDANGQYLLTPSR